MSDHFRIQMTAFPRIDLMSVGTGLANSVGVIAGLLVAFNYANEKVILCRFNRRTEQFRFAGTGTGDKVERQDMLLPEVLSVIVGYGIITAKDVFFDTNGAFC